MPKKFSTKNEGLQLFCNTFYPSEMAHRPDRVKRASVLMRFITALDAAASHTPNNQGITFNGERPNDHDALGHYIVNGGRMFFDMSQLSKEEQKWFAEFLMPSEIIKSNIIHSRLAGTHRIAKKETLLANGATQTFFYEKKLSPLKALVNFFREFLHKIKPRHFGMHIGIGGSGNFTTDAKGKKVTIRNNGEFGHMYFNTRPEAIQIGFEEAGPGMSFVPAGGWHGPDGKGALYSAFMTKRLEVQSFGPNGEDVICSPDDKNAVYAWNRILITSEVVNHLKQKSENDYNANNKYAVDSVLDILKSKPKNSEVSSDYAARNKRMRDYRDEHGLSSISSDHNKPTGAKLDTSSVAKLYWEMLSQHNNTLHQMIISLALFNSTHKVVRQVQKHITHEDGSGQIVKEVKKALSRMIIEEIKDKYSKADQSAALASAREAIKVIRQTASKVILGEISQQDAEKIINLDKIMPSAKRASAKQHS